MADLPDLAPGSLAKMVVAGLVLTVLVVLVTWQTILVPQSRSVGEANSPGQAGVGMASGLSLYPSDQRVIAPHLTGTTLDGEPFALSSFAGHVVVVNVWSSSCNPCRKETPDLARVAASTASRGVRFVGIDTRDNHAAAAAFVRTSGMGYPSVSTPTDRCCLTWLGSCQSPRFRALWCLTARGGLPLAALAPSRPRHSAAS